MKLQRKINIAVIGAGEMSSKIHLPILNRLADEGFCNLKIICDINNEAAKRAADKFNFEKAVTNAKEVFNDDVDAVYVLGTTKMHYEYGKEALLSGKHVFIEKPLTQTVDQLAELISIANKSNLIAVGGFNRRFQKNISRVVDYLGDNSKAYSLEALFNKAVVDKPVPYGAKTWFGANCIHAVDVLCYLMGDRPKSIYSKKNRVAGDKDQNFSIILEWENGSHATLSSNNSAGSRVEKYVLHSYGMSFECLDGDLTILKNNQSTTEQFGNSPEARGFYDEHKDFFLAINEGVAIRHSLDKLIASFYLTSLAEVGFSGEIDWNKCDIDLDSIKKTAKEEIDKKESIVVTNPGIIASQLPKLVDLYNIISSEDISSLNQEEREKVVAIITGRGGEPIKEEWLVNLPNIKVVGVVGASVKKYNPDVVVKRNIPLINVSDVYADTVAEFCLMQAIVGIRRASLSHDIMRKGGWGFKTQGGFYSFAMKAAKNPLVQKIKPLLIPLWKVIEPKVKKSGDGGGKQIKNNFHGSTIGLIGYGSISRKFIEYLKPFGCKVSIYSEHLSDEEARRMEVEKASLVEVLQADIVSLHRGLSDRTRKSFGKDQINSLKPGAIFINTSRGEIVDTDALISRLKKEDIFACLDVFDGEPLSKTSELRKLPNVFLTSHISGSNNQMYEAAAVTLVDKVCRYLEGERIDFVIDKAHLRNMT